MLGTEGSTVYIYPGDVKVIWNILRDAASSRSGNYRPVSLTSILGKVMEQLILEVIKKQVEENKVIRSSQHGFTKGKSCLTNLIAFYNGMTGWVGEGRAVDVVYLDFSKAFDSLPWYPPREAQEVWAQWVVGEVDWELAEWQNSEGCHQRH